MAKKKTLPPVAQSVEDAPTPQSEAPGILAELEGFHEYASSLRSLWHWIELLSNNPGKQTYFHEWLMEEIPIGNGFIYCPGTIPLGPIAPEFPNARTPGERALAIAIMQCQFYLAGLRECAVDNVDRLSLSLPCCQEYKQKIIVAVGVAKSRWNNTPGGVWNVPTLELANKFRKSWQAVIDLLLELFFIVDTEIHRVGFCEQSDPQTTVKNAPIDGDSIWSSWMPKKQIQRHFRVGDWRTLRKNSGKVGKPTIEENPDNNKEARYKLTRNPE
jgi:hypothetical protein